MPDARTPTSRLTAQPPGRRRPRGFSLVEVLVSLVVLSIGVLGAVGMQLTSLQASKEVRFQAVAGSMARELAEKMRGNHAIARKFKSNVNPYLISTTLAKTASVSTPSQNCYSNSCAAIDVANWDIADWQLRLRDALPAPRVVVCWDDAPFSTAGVPRWACSNTGDVAVVKLAWTRADSKGDLITANSAAAIPLLVLPVTAGSL